jgi:hypothetical protein
LIDMKINYRNRRSLSVFLLFVLPLVSIRPLFGSEIGRGGYAGSFLRMGAGARALGMGDGSVALIDDGYATYYNPAGLVFLEKRWITATYQSMALDRYQYYFGYSQSFEGKSGNSNKQGFIRGGFSIGWFSSGVSHIDARDFDGNDIGELSQNEHCFFFSFALNPDPRIAIGLSGKLLWNRFPGITDEEETISANGFGFDIGILLRILNNLSFGLTWRDLRSSYTWDTQDLWVEEGSQTKDSFPSLIRGGISLKILSNQVIVNGDLEKIEFWPVRVITGIQYEPVEGAFLRSGLKGKVVSFGAGYRFMWMHKMLQMDYAYVPDQVAPRANHVFTWTFLF